MLAYKSLTGRQYHLQGDTFVVDKKRRYYKTVSKDCPRCLGVAGRYYRGYEYNPITHNFSYVDKTCSLCVSTGIWKYKVFDREEIVGQETKYHSLCGTSVLRPETKDNTIDYKPNRVCSACVRVHETIERIKNE